MPAGHAQLPAEWPLKFIALPADATPGKLSALAQSSGDVGEVSTDGSTGHKVFTQQNILMDGWRVAFVSGRAPLDLYAGLEKELKPANWRIAPTQFSDEFRAYVSPDGAFMLGISHGGQPGKTAYEYQLMHSTPPQLQQAYATGKPIP
jgi:hypothetical protein